MADTTEMLRIIRHAADRLAEEDPTSTFSDRIGSMSYADDRAKAVKSLTSLRMAMGYAESVLRMVAACMDTEDAPAPAAVAEVAGGELDPAALYAKLDQQREASGLTWRRLAAEAGVSPSGLTKLGHGGHPSSDVLVRLLAWLGTTDLGPFLRSQEASR